MTALLSEFLPAERYTLPTGPNDVERLLLLDELYAPATEALLDELALPHDSRVADIGSGSGLMSVRFAARFGNGSVTGVDASPEQIELARERLSFRKLTSATFNVASAYETGLPSATFDLVFCRMLLCHLQRPLMALTEMRRLLKPGGMLLCEDVDSSGILVHSAALVEFDVRIGHALGVDFNIGPKLPRLFQAVGIADPRIKFFQPVFLRGRGKRFVEHTYAAHLPSFVAAGVTTRDEMLAQLATLRQINDDDIEAAPQFRLSQVWGRG